MTKLPVIRNCRFGEGCSKTWDGLEPTDRPHEKDSVRYCSACRRHVFRAKDHEDLWSSLELGYCVALVPETMTETLWLGGPRHVEYEPESLLKWD